jgi:hypothetical protein
MSSNSLIFRCEKIPLTTEQNRPGKHICIALEKTTRAILMEKNSTHPLSQCLLFVLYIDKYQEYDDSFCCQAIKTSSSPVTFSEKNTP